jgi:hypothetical protein
VYGSKDIRRGDCAQLVCLGVESSVLPRSTSQRSLHAEPLGVSTLEINQGDEVAGFISRAVVATVCIECDVESRFRVYNTDTVVWTVTLSVSEVVVRLFIDTQKQISDPPLYPY